MKDVQIGIRTTEEQRECLKIKLKSLGSGISISDVLRGAVSGMLMMSRDDFDYFVTENTETEKEINLLSSRFNGEKWINAFATVEKGITEGIVPREYKHYPDLDLIIGDLVMAYQEKKDEQIINKIKKQHDLYHEHLIKVKNAGNRFNKR